MQAVLVGMAAVITPAVPVSSDPAPIGTADYPLSALAAREQGTTGVRLRVDANGRVESCTVIASSGSAALDDATCKLLIARARFTPATDAQGERIADTVENRVVWKLQSMDHLAADQGFPVSVRPRDFEALRAAGKPTAVARLDVNEKGKLVGCRMVEPTGLPRVDAAVCRAFKSYGSFKAARDPKSGPIRMTYTQAVHFWAQR